jgi:hypothetical protein
MYIYFVDFSTQIDIEIKGLIKNNFEKTIMTII